MFNFVVDGFNDYPKSSTISIREAMKGSTFWFHWNFTLNPSSGDLRQGSSNNFVTNFVQGFPYVFQRENNPLLRTYYWWY